MNHEITVVQARAHRQKVWLERESRRRGSYVSFAKGHIEETFPLGFVVYVVSDGTGFHKIGRTKDFRNRMESLQAGNPRKLFLVCYQPCSTFRYANIVEKKMHQWICSQRAFGEWFSIKSNDCFRIMSLAAKSAGCRDYLINVCVGYDNKEPTDG